MSDESTNPVGTAQVTQNDQVVKEQTGDDFVLDFGDGGDDIEIESPAVETGNLEDEVEKSEQVSDSVDVDFDSGDLFGEEKEENENISKNDIEIQDEKTDDKSVGDDFNLSLDDNSESISEYDDSKNEMEQDAGDSLTENLDNEEISDNKNDIENSESDSPEYNLEDKSENLENQADEQVEQDEVIVDEQENESSVEDLGVNTGDEQVAQDEIVVDKQENENGTENSDILLDKNQEIDDKDLLNQDTLEKPSEENDIPDLEPEDNVKVSEDILDNMTEILDSDGLGEKNNENEGELHDNVDENLDVEYKPSLDDEEKLNETDEHFEAEDDGGNDEVFGDDLLDDEGETEKQDENNVELNIENTGKESDSENNGGNDEVFGGDLLDFDVNQDELQDKQDAESLEGDSKLDLQEKQDVESDGDRNEMEYGWDTSVSDQDTQADDNVGEFMGFDEVKNVTDVENFGNSDESDSNVSDNHDDIGMSFDSQLDGQNESETVESNEKTEESVDNLVADSGFLTENRGEKDMIKNNENDNGENLQNGISLDELSVGENGLDKEKDQKSDGIEIKSTLSLDEIMDSELQSGKFSEDKQKQSKEVANVASTNDGKGKRMFVVVAGIGIFLMAGAVAYLAFPNLLSTENDGGTEVVDIQEVQHPVALEVEVERVSADDSDGEIDDGQSEDIGALPYDPDELYESLESNPSADQQVTLDFPDPMGGDDSYVEGIGDVSEDTDDESLGSDYSIPTAYDWSTEEISDLDDEQDSESFLTIEEINKTITSYRNQGDMYYSMAQQNSDNRIYKYATRVLSLCDEYEERISNGEGVDEESYNKFTKDTSTVLTKLQDYTNDSEVQTIETGGMPDDYDEEKQSERRDLVTKRANGELFY